MHATDPPASRRPYHRPESARATSTATIGRTPCPHRPRIGSLGRRHQLRTPTAAAAPITGWKPEPTFFTPHEITSLDCELAKLTAAASPRPIEAFGVGADTAGALLVAAGDNPERLRSEAAFSMLCGSPPIKACSGKTNRHRLNRGGNRQANAALHRIVLVRMCYHQPTRDYVVRRTSEGKSKREIIHCLKRYVAREVYTLLRQAGEQKLAGAS
jgi:transposase